MTRKALQQFIAEGVGTESILQGLNRQIFLGSDTFVEQAQGKVKRLSSKVGVPRAQTRPPAPTLDVLASTFSDRDEVIVAAYATGEYSYQQIADYYGLHFTTVGNIVRRARQVR